MYKSQNPSSKLPVFKSRIPLPSTLGDGKSKDVHNPTFQQCGTGKRTTSTSIKLQKNFKNTDQKLTKSVPAAKKSPNGSTLRSQKVVFANKDNIHNVKASFKSRNPQFTDRSFKKSTNNIIPQTISFAKSGTPVNKGEPSAINISKFRRKSNVSNLKLQNSKSDTFKTGVPPSLQIKPNASKLKSAGHNEVKTGISTRNLRNGQRNLKAKANFSNRSQPFYGKPQSRKQLNSIKDTTFNKDELNANRTVCIESQAINVAIYEDQLDILPNLNNTFNSSSTRPLPDIAWPVVNIAGEQSKSDSVEVGESYILSSNDKLENCKKIAGNSFAIGNDDELLFSGENNKSNLKSDEILKVSPEETGLSEGNKLLTNESDTTNDVGIGCSTLKLDKYIEVKGLPDDVDHVSENENPALHLTFDLETEVTENENDSSCSQRKLLKTDILCDNTVLTNDANLASSEYSPSAKVPRFETKVILSPIIEDLNSTYEAGEVYVFSSKNSTKVFANSSKTRLSTTTDDESLGILNLEELDTNLLPNLSKVEEPVHDNLCLTNHIQKIVNFNNELSWMPQTSSPVTNSEFPGFADWTSPIENENTQ